MVLYKTIKNVLQIVGNLASVAFWFSKDNVDPNWMQMSYFHTLCQTAPSKPSSLQFWSSDNFNNYKVVNIPADRCELE